MKKMRRIILSALLLMVLFNGSALGASASYRCVIDQVGINYSGVVRVQLTALNGAFDNIWFDCNQDQSKEMLAILLTGSANNMVVRIWADPQSPEPKIINLFILP